MSNPFKRTSPSVNNTRPKLTKNYIAGKSGNDFLGQLRETQDRQVYQTDIIGGKKTWQAVVMEENAVAAPSGLTLTRTNGEEAKIISCKARIPLLTEWLPDIDAPAIIDCLPSYSTVVAATNTSQPSKGDIVEVNVNEFMVQKYDGGTINFTSPADVHGLPQHMSARNSLCKEPTAPGMIDKAKALVGDLIEKAKTGALSLVGADSPKKNNSSYTTKPTPPTAQTGNNTRLPPPAATNPDPSQATPPANLKCGTIYNLKNLPTSDTKNTGPNTTTDSDPNGEYPAYPLSSEHRLTSRFGKRVDPVSRKVVRMHKGVDFGCPTGTHVLATLPGVVVAAKNDPGGGGLYVKIRHSEHGGYYSLYMHCDRLLVRAGQKVKKGDQIAFSGNTGRGTGPHLHFETRTGPTSTSCIDPVAFLKTKLVRGK